MRETHLSFGEREFSSALATARSRGGETRHGALSDQIPLELGQGGEDSEHHATGRSRGVDLSALSSQNPQAVSALMSQLADFVQDAESLRADVSALAERADLTPEMMENLRALGYIE